MSEENKVIMKRLIEAFNKGNEDIYEELVAEDYLNHTDLPSPQATREGWKQKAAMFHKAFPDIHVSIDHLIAEGDYVVTAITSTGTHQGDMMGIPATGKKASVRGVHINKIVNGKIVARWELTDTMSLMTQLGVTSL